jgi:glycine oxidase
MSLPFNTNRAPDIVVIGAGLIGLAIALEIADRGGNVAVVDRGVALGGASTAAAGMLAAEDPGNPAELLALSRLSIEHYPAFLRRVETLSGMAVPFQTEVAVQHREDGSTVRLAEHSVDPRQLAEAVRAAVKATTIQLVEYASVRSIVDECGSSTVELSTGVSITAGALVYAAGAWSSDAGLALEGDAISVTPRKGQMLRVRLPFALDEVHRSERIYVVPRTRGPQAGTALIGATVEDVGFDTSVHSGDLSRLRAMAAEFVPELASEVDAPMVASWAGLRPATADGLPLLGACSHAGRFVATGHYRNGILLAPGTAVLMADLLEGIATRIDLTALSPQRFVLSATQ